MAYQVEFRPGALSDLAKLDRIVGQRILNKLKWLSENFEYLTPVSLTGSLAGLFKLRVGDYRVLYSVEPESSLLTIHLIGHRREIYRR
jgi:mRNA interferase RelE/StbE